MSCQYGGRLMARHSRAYNSVLYKIPNCLRFQPHILRSSGRCIFIRVLNFSSKGEHMAPLATTDVCDANDALIDSGHLRILPPIFQIYGKRRVFSGPIATLKVFEDNVLLRQLLESRGDGRVLVVDGGGSMNCALVGGNLGQIAGNMGWAGIVVNGCIRDVDEINECDIGVRALATHPKKSYKRGLGERHIPIHIAETEIHDGEWLYADGDGILISKTKLSV